jgi:type II secretory pathway component GspD/PulD (secretin)
VKWIWLISLCLLASTARPETAERVFHVYPLGQADLASTEEAVRALVDDDGSVVLDSRHHRLLVLATAAEHEKVAGLLKQVAVPARNVRIQVEFREQGSSRDSGFGVRGKGVITHDEGGTRAGVTLKPELRHQRTTTSANVQESLLVSSGREASLAVGEEVPYLDWLVDYGVRWGYLEGRVTWQQVGAKLVVQPTVLGDGTVRVRLTPELSGYADGRRVATRFARVATDVVVADGETMSIGGLNQDKDFYSRFLVGVNKSGSTQKLDILLTPRVEERRTRQP